MPRTGTSRGQDGIFVKGKGRTLEKRLSEEKSTCDFTFFYAKPWGKGGLT